MSRAWWGAFDLPEGTARRWVVGPTSLWVARDDHELKLAVRRGGDTLRDELVVGEPAPVVPPADHTLSRFVVSGGTGRPSLLPQLADRPVVVRPEVPFTVPPGGATVGFVSTPLWVSLSLDGPLASFPLLRPSDTWFGDNTIRGALCYAIRTSLRLNATHMPLRPHRGITPVRIRNDGHDPIDLRRVRLPVPQLTLFAAPDGTLWTNPVTIRRVDADGEVATVTVDPSPPSERPTAATLALPREVAADNVVQRVFNAFAG